MTLLLINFSARLKSVSVPTIYEQVGTTSFFKSTFSGLTLFCTQGVPYYWLVVLQRLLLAALVKVLSPDILFITQNILETYSSVSFIIKQTHIPSIKSMTFVKKCQKRYQRNINHFIEQNRKMTFFSHEDPTQELTQRNLKSPRNNPTCQEEIILNLQRENLYLKNQLFSLIQNSGAYDMYLPKEVLLSQNYAKNDRMFHSPNTWQKQMGMNTQRNQQYQLQFSPRRHCFSPRVQSYNNSSQLHQLGRTRSPELQRDFCRRLVINSNHMNRRPFRNSDNMQQTNTVRTSPSKLTPKESLIFTANPSPERNKLHFQEKDTYRRAKEKVNMLKRNAKSPSFLKNKHNFKENVKESLSGVIKGIQNVKSRENQCTLAQEMSKLGIRNENMPIKLSELPARLAQRRKSKTFTIQFSQGDSCLSIQCRLREIICEPSISKPDDKK